MKLASLLTPQQVILNLEGEVCADAISEIIDHLICRKFIEADLREEIVESLKAREQQISTGIGSGVAIPHAFSDNVEQVTACFARSKEGVDFEALDNAPVNFIVLFVVPKKDYSMHLQTLAAIAKLFNNCEIRQQLHEAESAEDVLSIFASRPSRTRCEQ
ncbi:MAG: PTS sugar transporter subunit IIA [Akkermansiaceae bacterium]